ncbi:MAG: glycosyltransferase family 2 protein [Cytophagaceae bacterium]
MPFITLIVAYRNREIERVHRFIEGINRQTYRDFDFIFVDFGSEKQYSGPVKELVTGSGYNYYYIASNGWPWNKSHALNLGIKLAKTEYILTTDIDLIYSPDTLRNMVDQCGPDINLHSRFYFLPKGFNGWDKLEDSIPGLEVCDYSEQGAMHLVTRKALMDINGFDEFYTFWGYEDIDVNIRLNKYGLKEKWIDHKIAPAFHQWHSKTKKLGFIPDLKWEQIMIYYFKNANIIKRNLARDWGKMVTEENRRSLTLLNSKAFKKVFYFEKFKLNQKSQFVHDLIDSLNSLNKGEGIEVFYEKKMESKISLRERVREIRSYLKEGFIRKPTFNPEKEFNNICWLLIEDPSMKIGDFYIENQEDFLRIILVKD